MFSQDQIIEGWNESIQKLRVSTNPGAFNDEPQRGTDEYRLSYDVQYWLDAIFFEIIKKSKVKAGDYFYTDEAIYPVHSYNQSREYESKQFGSEIIAGTTGEKFFIQTTLPNAECVWVQHDDWWGTFFSLVHNHDFYFYERSFYGESGKRNISEFLRRISEHVKEYHDVPDFGWLFVSWGNIHNAAASLDEGAKIFELLHKLVHGLYRTKYLRSKRRET